MARPLFVTLRVRHGWMLRPLALVAQGGLLVAELATAALLWAAARLTVVEPDKEA